MTELYSESFQFHYSF